MDFEKAFDRVDRTFLWELMRRLWFGERFIRIPHTLYETSVARVMFNGHAKWVSR